MFHNQCRRLRLRCRRRCDFLMNIKIGCKLVLRVKLINLVFCMFFWHSWDLHAHASGGKANSSSLNIKTIRARTFHGNIVCAGKTFWLESFNYVENAAVRDSHNKALCSSRSFRSSVFLCICVPKICDIKNGQSQHKHTQPPIKSKKPHFKTAAMKPKNFFRSAWKQ